MPDGEISIVCWYNSKGTSVLIFENREHTQSQIGDKISFLARQIN